MLAFFTQVGLLGLGFSERDGLLLVGHDERVVEFFSAL